MRGTSTKNHPQQKKREEKDIPSDETILKSYTKQRGKQSVYPEEKKTNKSLYINRGVSFVLSFFVCLFVSFFLSSPRGSMHQNALMKFKMKKK